MGGGVGGGVGEGRVDGRGVDGGIGEGRVDRGRVDRGASMGGAWPSASVGPSLDAPSGAPASRRGASGVTPPSPRLSPHAARPIRSANTRGRQRIGP